MPVKLFCGEEPNFENEKEEEQFTEVLNLIKDFYHKKEETVYVLKNFLLSNTQIDVLILTTKGPAILDLKNYAGKVYGSEEGDWRVKKSNGEEVKMPKNVFAQLRNQRFEGILPKLVEAHKEFKRVDENKLAKIQCWAYFAKGSIYNKSQIAQNNQYWFDVITADTLHKKLTHLNAGYILISDDMNAIVKKLGLKSCPEEQASHDGNGGGTSEIPVPDFNKKLDLSKFKGDVIILDALGQWVDNPSVKRAVMEKKNYIRHDDILKNLTERYGEMAAIEANTALREGIEACGVDFEKGFCESKEPIKLFLKTNQLLKDAIVARLNNATSEEHHIAWAFLIVWNFNTKHNRIEYPPFWQNDNFLKALKAQFNISLSKDMVYTTLMKIGFINKLEYVSVRGNYSDMDVIPSYLFDFKLKEHIYIPEAPDDKIFIKAYLEQETTTNKTFDKTAEKETEKVEQEKKGEGGPFPPPPIAEKIIIGSKEHPGQYGIIGTSDGKKVLMDLNAPHIIFVSGMPGAGKGYTIGVISEMLVGKGIPSISDISKPATVIVLYKPKDDVPSEFWSIRQPNDIQIELDKLDYFNARPMNPITEEQFKIFIDPMVYIKHGDKFKSDYRTQNIHPLYIDPSTLSGEDWANALATGGSSDALYVKKIFKILRNLPADFDMKDILNGINASDLNENQKGFAKARMEILDEYLKKDDLVNNLVIGGVNVVDFRKAMYPPDDIFTIMTLIMSKLQNKKEFENEPFVFIMNEAHLYFKKGISKEFLDTIENLIRRKRHGANWLLLDTHLPNDVDPKVIELSDIKVLHFTDKTVDSHVLKRILEGKDDRLYKLHTGETIICANQSSLGLSIPIHVNIRPRVSKHGGATKTATRAK